MSGHSKWATTKHRKGAQDAKRSALFSKLSRNITVAARLGGDPLPENNASLAAAVAKAKAQSMPKDKIKSAIDKAFGSGADAAVYENIVYEGYGPAGVAVYVDCLTDNRNRTAADVRSAFSHAGGNLGTSGSVAFQFERKGQIVVAKEVLDENAKKETMIANGAAGDEDEFMMRSPRPVARTTRTPARSGSSGLLPTTLWLSPKHSRSRASRSRAPRPPWSRPPRPRFLAPTPRRFSASSTVLRSSTTSRMFTAPWT